MRDVVGFEGLYRVSESGDVFRVASARGTRPGRKLKWSFNDRGYARVWMMRDGVRYERRVHQLVASAYIGPCPAGQEVDHEDDDRSNNHYTNLRYMTHGDNVRRCRRWRKAS